MVSEPELRRRGSLLGKRHRAEYKKQPGMSPTVSRVIIINMTDLTNQSIDIAYSKTYLSGGDTVQIHTGVSFRLLTVKTGLSFRFDVESSKTRICSIAAGAKLSVKLDTEKEDFVISTNGIFKIKSGIMCEVHNCGDDDIVLHVTSLSIDYY